MDLKNIEEIRKEMHWSLDGENQKKDILIVVHNQYEYIKNCVDSIFENTKNFILHVWDNGSEKQTADYLRSLSKLNNVKLHYSKSNIGFIVPNNVMAKKSKSKWIILLNSDTEVLSNWDSVLIGTLLNNNDVAQVGIKGGMLNQKGLGVSHKSGFDIDYVCGFCFCISRETYKKYGLFDDKHLEFAYCEDSDFSMRLRDDGQKIYACYASDLVRHYGNKTTFEVLKKQKELLSCAKKNQRHILKKWSKFIL
jgi:GT2 family glycosyltransferase